MTTSAPLLLGRPPDRTFPDHDVSGFHWEWQIAENLRVVVCDDGVWEVWAGVGRAAYCLCEWDRADDVVAEIERFLDIITAPRSRAEPAEPSRDTAGYLYAMRKQKGRRIKFGFSIAPERRAVSLATDDRVLVLASIPAWMSDEKRLHRALGEHRHYGEWYRPTRQVLDLVTCMRDGFRIEELLKKAGAT